MEIELAFICISIIILKILYYQTSEIPRKFQKLIVSVGKLVFVKLNEENDDKITNVEHFEEWKNVNWSYTACVIERILFIICLLVETVFILGFMLIGFMVR